MSRSKCESEQMRKVRKEEGKKVGEVFGKKVL
jgi:hypothetical protein